VVWGSDDSPQIEALELGGRVFRNADPAKVSLVAVEDLEAVGIDECDCRLPGYQDAGVIDVPDHAARMMDRSDCTGSVHGRAHKEAVVGFGEVLLSGARRVELKERLVLADQIHHKARKLAAAASDDSNRECDESGLLGQTPPYHRGDLGLALRGIGDRIDLHGATAAIAQ